jgi:hypothetical protein
MSFTVLTVGWEPYFANDLLAPIERQTGISFIHGLVGDASRIISAKQRYPALEFIALSKRRKDPLPNPDLNLLVSLESAGVPTIRSMIQGDRVLRFRTENESLGYATLLARRLKEEFERVRPNLILASHDSIHSAMSLAVAKSLGIPWVALTFPVIPDNLTGFCNALTPESLVPIIRPMDETIQSTAREIIQNVRLKKQSVVAYRAPVSIKQWVRQYLLHARNLLRRKKEEEILGIDFFTYPTGIERIRDILRRTLNRIQLPTEKMLKSPPIGKYVYYPFHMAPESMVDTWAPYYQDQLSFVAQLSLAIPADTTLVVKLHFSDPDNYDRRQLEQLLNRPNFRIAHPNASGAAFIENAALVVGITGTSCLEAALRGKPVLIFGDTPYVHFPRSECAKRPDKLHEQIVRMLGTPPPSEEHITEAYAAYMTRYMPGRINDWTKGITKDEICRYADCFRRLTKYLNDAEIVKNWYNAPPFKKIGGKKF